MKDKLEDGSALRQQVERLCASQQLCVLATQYGGQPYSNLIAFAETAELRNLIFVTSRNTRKYTNSISNPKVAMMIDNRKNRTADFKTALAVTAIGTAEEVSGSERDVLEESYISKHPHLAEFVNGSDKALMKVTVTDYIIARFDGVQFIHIGD
jgi:nitroimidazol reductase NimA-like FMN-containing flavoprotein (pyridoxamine 5'-phosphate oxidase superfamily)